VKGRSCITYCWSVLPLKNLPAMLHAFKTTYISMVTYRKSGKSSCLRIARSVWGMTPVAGIVTSKVWTASAGRCCFTSMLNYADYYYYFYYYYHNWASHGVEDRGFDSRWGHYNFSLTQSWPHYDPGVDSASNRNEYQQYFLGGKGGRCVGLTTLPPSCADSHEIWESQLPGTLCAFN